MKEILSEIERWQQGGEDVVVATVVANRRTAPRPVGSSLAISAAGKLCGSVSGGCVEGTSSSRRRRCSERRAEAALLRDQRRGGLGLGLPCGGEIDVFLERLP